MLDVCTGLADPVGTIPLLLPHTKQIGSLYFVYNRWPDIQRFSEVTSGPFPLLHTLSIDVVKDPTLDNPT